MIQEPSNYMDECIFCDIYVKSDKTASNVLFEDDLVIAFLDINPISKGHTLVIPKEHITHYEDLSKETAEHLASILQIMAPKVVSGVQADGYNLVLNNNEVAGQIIPHLHWHIIPRFKNDKLRSWENNKIDFSKIENNAIKIKKVRS